MSDAFMYHLQAVTALLVIGLFAIAIIDWIDRR